MTTVRVNLTRLNYISQNLFSIYYWIQERFQCDLKKKNEAAAAICGPQIFGFVKLNLIFCLLIGQQLVQNFYISLNSLSASPTFRSSCVCFAPYEETLFCRILMSRSQRQQEQVEASLYSHEFMLLSSWILLLSTLYILHTFTITYTVDFKFQYHNEN